VKFLRRLGTCGSSEGRKIAGVFNFARYKDFEAWVYRILPLEYELERLAPALAQDGPNPEYPWPRTEPQHIPATFKFDVWKQLTESGRGRLLLKVIDIAIDKFSVYG